MMLCRSLGSGVVLGLVSLGVVSCHSPAKPLPAVSVTKINQDIRAGVGVPTRGRLERAVLAKIWADKPAYLRLLDQRPLIRKPVRLLSGMEPVNPPPGAFERNEGGLAVVTYVVDERGSVEDARIFHASQARFERPALEAVRQWKFEPAAGREGARKMLVNAPLHFVGTVAGRDSLWSDSGYNRSIAAGEKAGKVSPFHHSKSKYRSLWADKPEYLALLESRPLVKAPRLVRKEGGFPKKLSSRIAAVDVSLVIGKDGSVEAARAVDSTDKLANEAAEKSMLKWKFEPAMSASGPEKVLWEQRFVFRVY